MASLIREGSVIRKVVPYDKLAAICYQIAGEMVMEKKRLKNLESSY